MRIRWRTRTCGCGPAWSWQPTGTTVLDVEVPSAVVAGTLSLDGAPPFATDKAHLVLRNAAGDYAKIPWSIDGGYSVNVVPGTYDLFYSKDNTVQTDTPANQLAKLRAGVVVAPAGTTVLDIDITSTIVMGTAQDQRRARCRGQLRDRDAALRRRRSGGDREHRPRHVLRARRPRNVRPLLHAHRVAGQHDHRGAGESRGEVASRHRPRARRHDRARHRHPVEDRGRHDHDQRRVRRRRATTER